MVDRKAGQLDFPVLIQLGVTCAAINPRFFVLPFAMSADGPGDEGVLGLHLLECRGLLHLFHFSFMREDAAGFRARYVTVIHP
jgi:hypothetical protein